MTVAEPAKATRPVKKAARTAPHRSPDIVRPQSIMSLGQGPLRTINWVDYGWPGCGKSCLFGTANKGLFLDCDNGGSDAPAALGSKCDVSYVNDYKELTQAFEYLRYEGGTDVYDWVFWDSITLFMDRSLYDDLLLEAHDRNPEKQSRDVASQREYLVQQNRISAFVRDFCDLPINFGVGAHCTAEETPESGQIMYLPLIPGKRGELSTKVCGYMNLVTYHQKARDGTQRLITQSTEKYFAKDRFNAVRSKDGWHINQPTVPKIEALIEQKRKASDGSQDQNRQGRRREGSGVRRLRGSAAGTVRGGGSGS